LCTQTAAQALTSIKDAWLLALPAAMVEIALLTASKVIESKNSSRQAGSGE
jgi:hypothetical protein